jgi:DNA topoisomerase II
MFGGNDHRPVNSGGQSNSGSNSQSSPLAHMGGQQYERLEHAEQIFRRPEMYLGATTGLQPTPVWIAEIVGEGNIRVKNQECMVPLALIGISKEVFDNAGDNAERSRVIGIDPGTIDIEMTTNSLRVRNYGKHIPVEIHHKEGIYVPQLLFGVLLTSDNYNDEIKRYKIGRNGYGVKLTNIFSVYFMVCIGDPVNRVKYTQVWTDRMKNVSQPTIEPYEGPGFTEITFVPNFPYLYRAEEQVNTFVDSMQGFYFSRAIETSFAAQVVTTFNSIPLDFRDARKFFDAHFEGMDPERRILQWSAADRTHEFVIADTPGKGWAHAFVNGTPVHQGEHVNEFLKMIFDAVIDEFKKKHQKTVRVDMIKKHVSILLRVTVPNPEFESQIKRKLEKPKPKVLPADMKNMDSIQKAVMKWQTVEELKKALNMKVDKKDHKVRFEKIKKVHDAIQANSSNPAERAKCTLILTEGETGCTLAKMALKYLPGGNNYNGVYPLRGKTMNVDRHKDTAVDNNKELSDIMRILNAEKGIDYYNDPKAMNKLRYRRIALMMDADSDGAHIQGLVLKFIYTYLKSLAPFEFVVIIMTPIIEGIKRNQKVSFYTQDQMDEWLKYNDKTGWNFNYKKGLGSWNPNDATVKNLFQNPVIVGMVADPMSEDMLKLAFGTKFTKERKEWLSSYDRTSLPPLRTPRPVSEFFNDEFRSYSLASIVRAIPNIMDGMKNVQRKVLYTALMTFTGEKAKKMMNVPQFAGKVMEVAGYHHGEVALFDTIRNMASSLKTGGNNIATLEGEGNFGTRRKRGADRSPSRYLKMKLAPITRFIFRPEDDALWEIMEEDGVQIEPKVLYPIIPMALVNKCKGIATGWSTDIPCHDPRVIIKWVTMWIEEEKTKRHIPKSELTIDVSTKPELIPWWRDYKGTLIRIRNQPYEEYRNEGSFNVQFHTVFVTELPAELSPDAYKIWGDSQEELFYKEPEKAILRQFGDFGVAPNIDFRISGMSSPTLEKLNLVRHLKLSNMVLIDRDGKPKKYDYSFEIMCDWCAYRLEIYEKRRLNLIKESEKRVRLITLKYLFIMDVVEARLELRNRPKPEVVAYMQSKGYPCNQKRDGDDFLKIPIGTITRERSNKLKQELGREQALLEYYKTVLPEDLWLKDLQELEQQVTEHYKTPLE